MDAEPKVLISQGMKFPADPAILTQKQRRLLRNGLYKEKEFAAVTALARPSDTVIELGAGMGYMSTAVALKCRVARVHAFEANPDMIPYITEVHRLNGVTNVSLRNAVLGHSAGTARFHIREEFPDSSLDPEPTGAVSGLVRVVPVEMLDIRATFAEIRPTFLICDIEGAEADLIPAADLSTLRCAVVELHPQWIGKAGVQAVFDAMAKAGLTFFPKTSLKKVVTFRRDW